MELLLDFLQLTDKNSPEVRILSKPDLNFGSSKPKFGHIFTRPPHRDLFQLVIESMESWYQKFHDMCVEEKRCSFATPHFVD